MENNPSSNEIELQQAFEQILSENSFTNYVSDIAELISKGNLNTENLNAILAENGITNIRSIREELLDLLLAYIHVVLNDNIISEKERNNIRFLKTYFKIREGDFLEKRKADIGNVLQRQFARQFLDDKIDVSESIHNVFLQEIFDLSYDQFDKFKEQEIKNALERGADITDLDTANRPKQ